jgi:biopolymer transport protein ExbD
LIQIDQLPEKVKDLQSSRSDKTVYIKADARSRYEVFENVVDSLRTAGVDQLGLWTEQIQDTNRHNPPAL